MKKKIRRWAALILVRTLILLVRVLPRRTALALFSSLGAIAFALYRKDRERAMRNILLAFPGTDPIIVRAMAKGSFTALARNTVDALRLTYLSREEILDLVTVEGEEHLRDACDAGKGVIALTGHIGCWELLAVYFARKGYKVSVTARDLKDRKMDELLVDMRLRHGIPSFPRGATATVAYYRVLKRGEILGILLDQDIDIDGTFVPFFGQPAYTPRGAAVFALRSGAAVVPLAIHMQPDGRHHVTVLPALEPPPDTLSDEERIDEYTRRAVEVVEKLIRIYPQQWVWFHDRWRTSRKRNMLKDVETAVGGEPRTGPSHAGSAHGW